MINLIFLFHYIFDGLRYVISFNVLCFRCCLFGGFFSFVGLKSPASHMHDFSVALANNRFAPSCRLSFHSYSLAGDRGKPGRGHYCLR